MGICAVGCRRVERVERHLILRDGRGCTRTGATPCPFQYLEDLLFTSTYSKTCSVLSMVRLHRVLPHLSVT